MTALNKDALIKLLTKRFYVHSIIITFIATLHY